MKGLLLLVNMSINSYSYLCFFFSLLLSTTVTMQYIPCNPQTLSHSWKFVSFLKTSLTRPIVKQHGTDAKEKRAQDITKGLAQEWMWSLIYWWAPICDHPASVIHCSHSLNQILLTIYCVIQWLRDNCHMVWGFPGVSVVKNLPVSHETRVQPLGQEDPLV